MSSPAAEQVSVQDNTKDDATLKDDVEQNEDNEDLDDLFGDEDNNNDDDDDDDENVLSKKSKYSDIDANDDDIDDDSDNQDQKQGQEEAENEEEEEELQTAELSLPRHPRSHHPQNNKAYNFSLPRFLFVDPEPFAPTTFEDQLKEFLNSTNSNSNSESSIKTSLQFKKLELTNTIRWRYAKNSTGGLYKQSNANIIEWEDGSKSLKIGNEYFDIRTKLNDDNLLAFQGGQVLISLMNLNNSIQVLPPSMNSKAHKILASTLTTNMKMKKLKKINTIVTNEDPELKARETERVQKEIERARKRQLAKLQLEEERQERRNGSTNGSSLNSRSNSYKDIDLGDEEDNDNDYGYSKSRGGEYANDDFVVSDDDVDSGLDDDELDEAAERLKKVKRDGAAKYRDTLEEEEDEQQLQNDDDDDEGTIVRKKRRIVLQEDDE